MTGRKRLGFWTVTSLVAGSQIGSGVFLLPASLAPYGAAGLSSWLVTATGAIILALIFAKLCARIPETGGPHAYVQAAFGKRAGFFAAWSYWVISWMSTPAVVIAIVGYLSPFTGPLAPSTVLALEIGLVFLMSGLNCLGVRSAGAVELFFTALKLFPLLFMPLIGMFHIETSHFAPFNPTQEPTLNVIHAAAVLTLWGFIGLESATAPAEAVQNPHKTIPRAITIGTIIVALVYIANSVVILGIVPADVLAHSKAPFAEAAVRLFGTGGDKVISAAAAIVCIGTLNAWILTSGQISMGASRKGLFPAFLGRVNRHEAPIWSIMCSGLGMIPFFVVTMDPNLINQVNTIIDISVTAFLLVYSVCTISFLVLILRTARPRKMDIVLGIMALLFCSWSLWAVGMKMVLLACLIPLFGSPLYIWRSRHI